MPYKSNKDLPEAVRSALPAKAQGVFRNAYNSAAEEGMSEEKCNKIAWGAVKNAGWKKEGDKWVLSETEDDDTTIRVGTDKSTVTVRETIALDEGAKIRVTGDGYLAAQPRVARTGIQLYRGYELGKPAVDVVRVYRPAAEVFSADSLHSYAHRPVTNNHPPVPVTADNWKKFAVGQTGDEVMRDGSFVRVPMVLMDKEVIGDYKRGKRELSLGYTMDLIWQPGVSPDGEAYDAVQSNIRANHLAVVAAARGGPELRIGDDINNGRSSMELVTFAIDGVPVQTTDVSRAVIERHMNGLQSSLDKLKAKLEGEEKESKAKDAKMAADAAAATAAIQTKDAEIATLKKALEDAKASASPQALDALVKSRGETIERARSVLGDVLVVDGRTEADIRKQVVSAKLGDLAKDWNDDMVAASFKTLVDNGNISVNGTTRLAQDLSRVNPRTPNSEAVKAYDSYCTNLQNAWRGGQQQKTA